MNHLDRAREEIRQAAETAPGPDHTQLNSLDVGIDEEEGGGTTQDEPGPKRGDLLEVTEKLHGLDEEIDDAETSAHVQEAIDHLQTYLADHPEGS